MKPFLSATVLFLSPVLTAAQAVAEGFDAEAYDTFIANRVGDGEPVYWYSTGTIKSYPDGELLFRMVGFDAARMHAPEQDKPYTHQYNRKIYFYADPDTGEILQEWNGADVEPIAYPYQFITYELKGDALETFVEQGVEPGVQRFGPSTDMSAQRIGDTLVVSAPVFLDFEIPNTDRRIDAYEHYDFFLQPEGAVAEPQQLSWVRYGDLPAWAAAESKTGKAIYHLVTWRVEDWKDVPDPARSYVEENYPLWMQPPADLEEIRNLQTRADSDEYSKGF